ncbi:MAG: ribosome recycling factor, partial [Spirochaetia bacterium]|nr:ribosome recycling factor [Spirochaetia bacterium]
MPDAGQSIDDVLLESEDRMAKSIESLGRDLGAIRSTRASPAMVENITVDYYGTPTPLKSLAGINIPEPRMILITPYDKGARVEVEKAILKSDLGITPQTDGNLIRIVLPELSMQRRQELVK